MQIRIQSKIQLAKNENLIDQNKSKLGTKGGKLAATFKNQKK